MKQVMAILLIIAFMLFHALSKIHQQSSFHSRVSDVPAPLLPPAWAAHDLQSCRSLSGQSLLLKSGNFLPAHCEEVIVCR